VTTAQPTSVSTLIPWTQATATLVRKDGTSATVNASSVRLACGSENLGFENGQQISLQLVRSIQFDAIYMTTGSADAVVTLLDGQQLTDAIRTRNCPVHGENELGQLDIGLEDIERIDFRR